MTTEGNGAEELTNLVRIGVEAIAGERDVARGCLEKEVKKNKELSLSLNATAVARDHAIKTSAFYKAQYVRVLTNVKTLEVELDRVAGRAKELESDNKRLKVEKLRDLTRVDKEKESVELENKRIKAENERLKELESENRRLRALEVENKKLKALESENKRLMAEKLQAEKEKESSLAGLSSLLGLCVDRGATVGSAKATEKAQQTDRRTEEQSLPTFPAFGISSGRSETPLNQTAVPATLGRGSKRKRKRKSEGEVDGEVDPK